MTTFNFKSVSASISAAILLAMSPTFVMARINPISESKPTPAKALAKTIKLSMDCELEEETIYDSDGYHPIGTQLIDTCHWQEVDSYLKESFSGKAIKVEALNSQAQDLKESGTFRGEHTLNLELKIIYIP